MARACTWACRSHCRQTSRKGNARRNRNARRPGLSACAASRRRAPTRVAHAAPRLRLLVVLRPAPTHEAGGLALLPPMVALSLLVLGGRPGASARYFCRHTPWPPWALPRRVWFGVYILNQRTPARHGFIQHNLPHFPCLLITDADTQALELVAASASSHSTPRSPCPELFPTALHR